MDRPRFDQMTKALSAGRSRRRVLQSLGAAALVGMPWSRRGAQGEAPGGISPPTSVSPHPIPLGGDKFLMNGKAVAVDLEAAMAAFRQGATAIRVVVDEATYVLDPTLIGRAKRLITPIAAARAQPTATATPPLPEGQPPVEILESQCGTDVESQDVEQYNGDLGVTIDFVSRHQPMVGVLRWRGDLNDRYQDAGNVNGVRWCSGTLIADDLFLTAGHCITSYPPDPDFKVPRSNGTETPIPRHEVATNMKVEFDYQLDQDGNDRPPRPFKVVELVESEWSQDRDYSIVRLEGKPGQDFGTTPLTAADPPRESRLCIIGHPQGQLKRVATGYEWGVDGNHILHDIDTEGGSSGSGILASPNGPIVAIHISGGCGLQDNGKRNHGVRIAALLDASATLRRLCANR